MKLRIIGLQQKRWHGKVARRAFADAVLSAGAGASPDADVMVDFDASPSAVTRVHLQNVPVGDAADVIALATIVLATAEWRGVDQALPHAITQLRGAWPSLVETILAAKARGERTSLGTDIRRATR